MNSSSYSLFYPLFSQSSFCCHSWHTKFMNCLGLFTFSIFVTWPYHVYAATPSLILAPDSCWILSFLNLLYSVVSYVDLMHFIKTTDLTQVLSRPFITQASLPHIIFGKRIASHIPLTASTDILLFLDTGLSVTLPSHPLSLRGFFFIHCACFIFICSCIPEAPNLFHYFSIKDYIHVLSSVSEDYCYLFLGYVYLSHRACFWKHVHHRLSEQCHLHNYNSPLTFHSWPLCTNPTLLTIILTLNFAHHPIRSQI